MVSVKFAGARSASAALELGGSPLLLKISVGPWPWGATDADLRRSWREMLPRVMGEGTSVSAGSGAIDVHAAVWASA